MLKGLKKLLLGSVVLAGLPFETDVTQYVYRSKKVKNAITFVVLSDLHGQSYGEHMKTLIDLVKMENPDIILLPGDLFDEYSEDESAWDLIQALQDYPMFYVTGNHEEKREDLEEIKKKLKENHVCVLEKESVVVTVEGTSLEIGGIPCRRVESDYTVEEVNAIFHTDNYRILLSHRPHWVNLYQQVQCDWVISGHAHGGQWCIPMTHIGLGAPQQGFLPKYTKGVHPLGDKHLLISRGLVRHYHYIPRLFNNPEVVVLKIQPKYDKVPIPG